MSRIYQLEADISWKDHLLYAEGMKLDTVLCAHDPRHTTRHRWNKPLKVVGPVIPGTDFEWTVYLDLIVNREIVESLKNMGFSGMRFLPVEFYTTTQTPFGREAYELNVTGWGGTALPASGIRVLNECPACKRQVFSEFANPSKLFNFDEWDGSDFFIIWPMPRFIMITGRVRDHILEKGYSGVKITPVDRLQKSIAGGFTPGHIGDWFDERRAKEILNARKSEP